MTARCTQSLRNRVQLDSATGRYVKTIGDQRGGFGQYQEARGVCVSRYCHVLVANCRGDGCIVVYDAAGKHVWTKSGFSYPWDLRVDKNGHLYL